MGRKEGEEGAKGRRRGSEGREREEGKGGKRHTYMYIKNNSTEDASLCMPSSRQSWGH